MPHFGFTSPRSWLSYRVGWLFGAGLSKVGREASFLVDRTKTASALERSAWLYRCVISFALVGAEFGAARLFFDSRFDHVFSLPLAVCILLVLPRPHVRWPLLIARAFVLVTVLAALERAHVWSMKSYPETFRSWDSAYSLCSLVLMLGLWIWVVFALRPRAAISAVAASGQQGEPAVANTIAHWSNIPQVKMQDAGGAAHAKAEILSIARNRLTKHRSSVVQNGILLYGPQGTGKNLLAEATGGEFGVNFYHVRCSELAVLQGRLAVWRRSSQGRT